MTRAGVLGENRLPKLFAHGVCYHSQEYMSTIPHVIPHVMVGHVTHAYPETVSSADKHQLCSRPIALEAAAVPHHDRSVAVR